MKPCPFCNSTDIRFSIKVKQQSGKVNYHIAMSCNDCHTFGPRVLLSDCKLSRYQIEKDETFKKQAESLWDIRHNDFNPYQTVNLNGNHKATDELVEWLLKKANETEADRQKMILDCYNEDKRNGTLGSNEEFEKW